jgi:hypothetical protein
MVKLITVVSILIISLELGANSNIAPGYDIIIIAGQSNASGMGCCATDYDKQINSRIKQLGRIGKRDYRVIPASFPLHSWNFRKKLREKKIGFGLEFAREYEKSILAKDRKVLIINTAMGGTGFANNGVWNEGEKAYEDAVTRALFSLHLDKDKGYKNKVVAVLWQQGEYDTSQDNKNYYRHLRKFIRSFRTDLGGDKSRIPFYLGQPVETWKDGGAVTDKHLRRIIKKVARVIKDTYVVSSSRLKSNKSQGTGNDEIHFSAKAQRKLGRRYFRVFQKTN